MGPVPGQDRGSVGAHSLRARRLARLVPWLAAALAGLLIAGVALSKLSTRQQALAAAGRELSLVAESASTAIARRLEALDFALSGLIAQADPGRFDEPAHRIELHHALSEAKRIGASAYIFVVMDHQARLIATSRPRPDVMEVQDVSFSEAFRSFSANPDRSLRVSRPRIGRIGAIAGKRIISVSRAIFTADDRFAGVVEAIAETEDGEPFLPRPTLRDDTTLMLLRRDGILLAARPEMLLPIGIDLSGTRFFHEELATAQAGLMDRRTVPDQLRRLGAWSSVGDGEMVVVAVRPADSVLGAWLRSEIPSILATAMFALALVGGAVWLRRLLLRLDGALDELSRRETELLTGGELMGITFWTKPNPGAPTAVANPAIEQLTGYSKADIASATRFWRDQVVHPDDLQAYEASYDSAALVDGWRQEYRIIHADGSVRWVEERARSIALPTGRPGPVFGIVQDITMIRAARERLSQQERRLADAGRVAGVTFWRLAEGSDRFEWFETTYRQYGVDSGLFEPTLDNVMAMIDPDDRDRVRAAMLQAREGNERSSVIFRLRRPDGQRRWRWWSMLQEYAQDGARLCLTAVSQDVTEQHEARERLLTTELQLATAGKAVGLAFWRRQIGSDRLEWSDEYYKGLGLDPATFTPTQGATLAMVVEDDRPVLEAAVNDVMSGGEATSLVIRMRIADGSIRWRWKSFSAEHGPNGRIVAISGVSQDVTDHMLARERLSASEARLIEAGRVVGLGFWRHVLGADRMEWSEEVFRQCGFDPATFVPTMAACHEQVLPADRDAYRATLNQVATTGEAGSIVWRIRRPDGQVRWRWTSIEAERDAQGTIVALHGVSQDVTDQQAERERLSSRERQLAEAGRIADLGFWRNVIGQDEVEWSEAIYRQSGFDPATFQPRMATSMSLVLPEDLPAVQAAYDAVRRTGEPHHVGFRIRHPDGAMRWRWTAIGAERGLDGEIIALNGVSQDVTAQHEARERLTASERKLAEAGRVAGLAFWRHVVGSGRFEWGEAMYEQCGVPADYPTTAENCRALIHPLDRAALFDLYERVINTGQAERMTFRLCRPDGVLRWRWTSISPEFNTAGRVVALNAVSQDITDQRAARERLTRNERLVADAGRIAALSIWRRDLATGKDEWDDEAYRQYGVDPASFQPTTEAVLKFIHAEDRATVDAAIARAFATGERVFYQFRITRPDGVVRWRAASAYVETDSDGTQVALVGITRDVTEEIEARERIEEQRRQLDDAGRVAGLGFWRRNADSAAMVWSDAVYRHWGMVPGEVEPTVDLVSQRMHPDDVAAWRATAEALVATRQSQALTVRVRGHGTAWRHIRISAGIQALPDGGSVILGVTQDLTDEVTAREDIARQQRQLADAGRVAGLGFWRLDIPSGRFAFNDEIFAQFGVEPATFDPTLDTVRAIVVEEDHDKVFGALERVARTGEREAFIYRLRRPDGSIRHRSTTAALEVNPDGGPAAIIGLCQDVTDKIEAETRLAHAERLNALGQLTGGIAHDVNNLLSVIGLNLELLHEQLNGEALEMAEAALHAVGQGATLTRGLLTFAQRQPLHPTQVEIGRQVEAIGALLRRTLGGAVTLALLVDPDLPPVIADSAQLETALINLVLNARDAMPRGGTVRIEATLAKQAEVERADLAAGQYVRFAVIDDGEGMPIDVLARAFEPFFTTKGAGKGTGLGLAMVYGFARQSGGHVGISSIPGSGTAVSILLPAARATSADAVADPAPDLDALARRTLLLVEDEAPLRALLSRICQNAGMLVHEASTGREAIDILAGGTRFDLVLSDIRMPGGVDGHSVARFAATLSQSSPTVLLMTGFDDREDGDHGLVLLRKPFNRRVLLDTLIDAVGTRATAEPVG